MLHTRMHKRSVEHQNAGHECLAAHLECLRKDPKADEQSPDVVLSCAHRPVGRAVQIDIEGLLVHGQGFFFLTLYVEHVSDAAQAQSRAQKYWHDAKETGLLHVGGGHTRVLRAMDLLKNWQGRIVTLHCLVVVTNLIVGRTHVDICGGHVQVRAPDILQGYSETDLSSQKHDGSRVIQPQQNMSEP